MAATLTAIPEDEKRSIIQFLTLENVLGAEIHTRMCVAYGMQNAITKLTVN